ncbi:SusD/RagB family nutrient-binding outer membrane lipoprotein [Olivibacter domesticus]|uniref:Starch-binding associating with outer membrane n=1 Tax=Olivibacter domesticus TaxID=407022 RepID=A0A1H7MG21_OLID1|nr:SusD/RagB family nutrient-binding outer membrane lipoprotein [Olivibacter domesticus]SEL10019.1 Starch-binding associating with outer membrane [Olivibacter domesticus]
MKKIKYFLALLGSICFSLSSCDKNFETINTNEYGVTNIDPALLFSNAERLTHVGAWEGEQTIVQQFVNAYNLGATAGFNFNEDNNNFNIPKWNSCYENAVKLLVEAIQMAQETPERVNLMSMMRIWKAYVFMTLVDTYGDVPYSEAGKAYQQIIFYPVYDDDRVIYEDLYNELKSAVANMNPAADYVTEDFFYGATGSAAAQVVKWKRLGNSLLLRLGMRYSKVDPEKARAIVQEAVDGGVMESNDDDAYMIFTNAYNSTLNDGAVVNAYYYYLAEPFVNQLKSTNDPRAKYIAGKYADPNAVLSSVPDVTLTNQFGFPVGYDQNNVAQHPNFRGRAGTGFNYSQLNYAIIGNPFAPLFYITHSQTKLLMAEAAYRNWISGSPQAYYEEGIRASMDQWSLYPNTPDRAISEEEKESYVRDPLVAFNTNNALELINTQYWVSNIGNGTESFANFRRSGFPALTPNRYNNNLNGGFVRRMAYPNDEMSENPNNYQAVVAAMGGDNLSVRVFWDIE